VMTCVRPAWVFLPEHTQCQTERPLQKTRAHEEKSPVTECTECAE
jgi:hypothetical protein